VTPCCPVLSPSEVCASARCCGPVQRPSVALVWLRLPRVVCPMRRRRRTGYWLPRCSGRQWPGAVCKLQAQRAAFPRLRRSHTCRCGRCLRGRSAFARGERSLSRRRRCVPASSPGVSKMPLRRYQCAASGPGGRRLATVPAIGQGDATLPGAFRPCRSSRLRRFAPLRTLQGPRPWGPRSTRVEPAPSCVSPTTDPGVHAVSAPAAMSAVFRSVLVPFGARTARIVS
jgi:hypothetical protein